MSDDLEFFLVPLRQLSIFHSDLRQADANNPAGTATIPKSIISTKN